MAAEREMNNGNARESFPSLSPLRRTKYRRVVLILDSRDQVRLSSKSKEECLDWS